MTPADFAQAVLRRLGETLRAIAKSPWGCTICANVSAASLQYYANKQRPSRQVIRY